MAMWTDYLQNIADALDVTQTQAGVWLSLVFTVIVICIILISTRGKSAEVTVPIGSLFMIILFSFMGWFPVWLGSVIALFISIFLGYIFTRTGG